MTAIEVRRRARGEHGVIRERLSRLEQVASRLARGERGRDLRSLERGVRALRRALHGHLSWEGEEAPPAFTAADARGPERLSRLETSHRDLREVLDFCHHSCDGVRHPVLLAQRALDLGRLLRTALDGEERSTLHPDAPRDDGVAIDPVSG